MELRNNKMLRKLIMSLCFFATYTYAGFTLDLTDPKNLEIADIYPSYEMISSVNFNDTDGNTSILGFKYSKDSEDWDAMFIAEISANKDGKKKIYISLASTCSDSKKNMGNTTIKTNDQNVKYHRFCDGENIYITPISKAGDNFLVNEFKKSDSVKFEFSDIMVLFDASGFTKKWNGYGGDAL